MWPQDDGSIAEVLGSDLGLLNVIRMDQRVYVEWCRVSGLPDVLKITSDSSSWDTCIAQTIKGIRSIILSKRARVLLAAPKYFVVPPTAAAMRALIGPKYVNAQISMANGVKETKNTLCIGTELIGEKLSDSEKVERREKHSGLMSEHVDKVQSQLTDGLLQLAPLKAGMRMRVHFGHLYLKNFGPKYPSGQMTIGDFEGMMKSAKIKGEVDKGSVGGYFDRCRLFPYEQN